MTNGTGTGRLRIAITGGGIGGLTLALALRQRGIAAEISSGARTHRDRRGRRAVRQLNPGTAPPRRSRPDHRRLNRADRVDLPRLAGRPPHRGPSDASGPAVPEALRCSLLSASTAPTCSAFSVAHLTAPD